MVQPGTKAVRLAKGVRPSRYAIELTADPAKPAFEGRVSIDVQLREPANEIVLHARALRVVAATLTPRGTTDGRPTALDVAVDAEAQLLRFTSSAAGAIAPGGYTVAIH